MSKTLRDRCQIIAVGQMMARLEGEMILLVTLEVSVKLIRCRIKTGNPYKELLAALQKRGVRVELCGATAKVHHWGNADLLPNIKINTDAMSRLTQLVQEGFVKMTE